jgi:protein-disulfide isomerase
MDNLAGVRMSKQFWGVIVVIILIFVGIFAFGGNKTAVTGKVSSHVEGKGTTGVTLVEYGDYQCPYCGQYYPILKQVQAEYGDRIHFQFRNFPLTSVHPNAFAGARAAEAAALQGKFWEMHDLLYENQNQWSVATDPTNSFKQYAVQLKLNVNKFTTDYVSDEVNGTINADMAKGNALGITGTPTFFLDGKQIQVSQSLKEFEKVLNAEISKKRSADAAAAKPQDSSAASSTTNTTSQ